MDSDSGLHPATTEAHELVIGDWVRRVYVDPDYENTRAHRVESVIQDSAITKCGRRMKPHAGASSDNYLTRLDIQHVPTDEVCEDCK